MGELGTIDKASTLKSWRDGSVKWMIGTTARLSVEEAKGVLSDKALLHRIWCPIDVLDETLWAEANNAWILPLARSALDPIEQTICDRGTVLTPARLSLASGCLLLVEDLILQVHNEHGVNK